MYNPSKNGQYIELFTQVYDQGQELARQGEVFNCPYRKVIDTHPAMYEPYAYDYAKVLTIEDDFYNWFYNGYYDYNREEDKAFLKLAVPKVKKAVKKKSIKKKTTEKLPEVLKEFEGKEMTY